MYAFRVADRPTASLPGLAHRTLAGSAEGLQRLSVWQQSIEAGAATPPHHHDCEEVVVVSAGCGELHIDGAVIPFASGSVLVIPPGIPHQILNSGTGTMDLVAAFSVSPVDVYLPNGEALPLPWPT